MNNLIKNEITKILKKKSFYIIMIVILGYVILSNAMYKYFYHSVSNYDYYTEDYIKMLEDEIKTLDTSNSSDLETYIVDKNDIDMYNLLKKYEKNTWQYKIANEKGRNYINNINEFTYRTKDENELENAKTEYEEFIKKLASNDWKTFVNEEMEQLKASKDLSDTLESGVDIQIEVLQMRLDYNIEYGNDFRNEALSSYAQNKMTVLQLEKENNKTYEEKLEYQTSKSEMEKSKYIIQNNKDIENYTNLRGSLINIFSRYETFIIIAIVLISGAIVSEEFNKGTIKLLLVRPYSRLKILLAKFITVIITVLFTIVITIFLQLIVGGIFFGFDSLSIPAIVYNYQTNSLIQINIAKYVSIIALGKLPIYILIGTLAFVLSTLFNNTGVAITISLLGYMASSIVNQFAYYYNIKWLKFFVTPNWDFTQFLYGKLPQMEGLTMPFSLIICIIYFAIRMIPAFVVFKKKNIKNI